MKVSVLAVGKPRGALESVIREFEVRAAHYWKLDLEEVNSGSGRGSSQDVKAVQASEGQRLLARVPKGSETWALAREGSEVSSVALAEALAGKALEGVRGITFLVGGTFGLSPEVLERADRRMSLSPMTLRHELARLVLTEQLYRAGTILRNEPYHKGGS